MIGNYARVVGLELDASALSFATMGAYNPTTGTIIVRVYTEGAGTLALADVAAGSNNGNWCHILLDNKFRKNADGSGL